MPCRTAARSDAALQADLSAPGVGTASGRWWTWRGQRIRFVAEGEGPAVLLLHGFGASADYFRKMLPVLVAQGYSVWAVDLLGLGLSGKPVEEDYSISLWAEQVRDFIEEQIPQAPVLVGNSLGSLVALKATADGVDAKGIILLNCAGGMNTGHMASDELTPQPLKASATVVTALLNALLSWRAFASWFFDRVRTAENVSDILKSIYSDKSAVDDFLVESILAPSREKGALDVFVKILTGDSGPSPDKLMPSIQCPVKLVWGDDDKFTPVEGAYGKYFRAVAGKRDDVSFALIPGGHCLHDDNPEDVHAVMLPWLEEVHK